MAQRSRKNIVRYGGWNAGTLNGSVALEPIYNGQHSCTDEVHPGPPYRTGGPLLIQKKKVFLHRTANFSSRTLFTPVQAYSGHMCVLAYVPSPEPTPLSLAGWGSKGWNRAFPVHPIYNLGVSLAEVRDVPRMITQTWRFFNSIRGISLSRVPRNIAEAIHFFKRTTRNSADDYLNLQFGWVPFLQDLEFILSMQRKLEKKLAWLKKHNGKSFRRKFEMDKTEFSEDIARLIPPYQTLRPILTTELYAGSGLLVNAQIPIQKTYNHRIWFSSKWRMYIPELANHGTSHRLNFSLLGLDLDPSVVYKATPWSWLLDWFVNVGAILQNIYLRARYHVVAEYAYVMCRESFTYQAPGYTSVNTGRQVFGPGSTVIWTGKPLSLSGVSSTVYEFRQREEANPYGFGITFSSLSTYQWSILAALGLSRRSKHSSPRS